MEQQIRQTRTNRYLLEALEELSRTKNIRDVKVTELCEKAQVNRSTFYKHHDNMAQFIEHVVDEFLHDMDESVGNANIFREMFVSESDEVFILCANFMRSRSSFVRMMTGPNGTPDLKNRICAEWSRQFREAVDEEMPDLRDCMSLDILTCYAVSSMWGLLEFFVQENSKYTPEYLAVQMRILLRDCTFKTLMERSIA